MDHFSFEMVCYPVCLNAFYRTAFEHIYVKHLTKHCFIKNGLTKRHSFSQQNVCLEIDCLINIVQLVILCNNASKLGNVELVDMNFKDLKDWNALD